MAPKRPGNAPVKDELGPKRKQLLQKCQNKTADKNRRIDTALKMITSLVSALKPYNHDVDTKKINECVDALAVSGTLKDALTCFEESTFNVNERAPEPDFEEVQAPDGVSEPNEITPEQEMQTLRYCINTARAKGKLAKNLESVKDMLSTKKAKLDREAAQAQRARKARQEVAERAARKKKEAEKRAKMKEMRNLERELDSL
jgi:hypothetical protein